MNNKVIGFIWAIVGLIIGLLVVFGAAFSHQSYEVSKCDDGIYYDKTAEGADRVTYLPVNDMCEK